MEAFRQLSGIAAPLLTDNIDTDAIIPVPWLKKKDTDLGHGLFGRWRYINGDVDSTEENPDFILNQAPYREAKILFSGRNFGCGSSREHAVWALMAWDIRCVIAESFGDIFHNNCYRNGLLPVILTHQEIAQLVAEAENAGGSAPTSVDLESCRVTGAEGGEFSFEVDSWRREALLEGLDYISSTLTHQADILAFREADRQARPWAYWPGADRIPTGD